MSVLVDTTVWSELFRRTEPNAGIRNGLRLILEQGEALIFGPIRQELLSGIKHPDQCERLRKRLRAFDDLAILTEDYEEAAVMRNKCRSSGIQGSNTDFLICAVAVRLSTPIFTLDQDFELFARVLPIRLYDPSHA
ncbi:type II toxin-antitoxin system VapC family toxin [Fimbriimonas ginsengisoli]|uniref:Ribonuclease VapC n=1 Tax=Fimbriimonas ginsengisoli Gsoil 348 TaxID=661478 RepID=A0A068NN84_FIMGI|nr:PIN domain-containing protein [Fimbriimonas ginsengisoli]AIE84862.1 PilT protein domain protein [Fimbriimonas ginsengisoli Gsoil 348]